jgi:hypothetical protein
MADNSRNKALNMINEALSRLPANRPIDKRNINGARLFFLWV